MILTTKRYLELEVCLGAREKLWMGSEHSDATMTLALWDHSGFFFDLATEDAISVSLPTLTEIQQHQGKAK